MPNSNTSTTHPSKVQFVLGRMIELTETERYQFRSLAQYAHDLADDQSPGWFVKYGRCVHEQARMISEIVGRHHDD